MLQTHRAFFDKLGRRLGFTSLEDWYLVKQEDFIKHGANGLLEQYYHNSPTEALLAIYPDFGWVIWKFKTVPQGFWKDKRNQQKFFDWVGNQLGFKSFEDWYKITRGDIGKFGGSELLSRYNKSPMKALMSIYSEFSWIIWKFDIVAIGFWKHYDGAKDDKFLYEISNTLQITNLNEWYRVSRKDLQNSGAEIFVKRRGGLMMLLSGIYPNHNWNRENFLIKQRKSSQWLLLKTIQEIFPPGIEILEEYQFQEMLFLQTGIYTQLYNIPIYLVYFRISDDI